MLGQIWRTPSELEIMSKVQAERDQLATLKSTRTLNKFLVGRNSAGTQVTILQRPGNVITPSDALLLAAWLVEAADPSPDLHAFKSMLLSIRQDAST